ncbi:hypothetical protein SUGI_0735720 [Cryptomeria japonica]|uniref:mitochondrial phosphate carrier protein 3, mitochondrial n=1 Tax=Cryptomeria japonica TaxID=3369 RepID=UPI0024148D26|nr:mitochondrial phosphate carrier protein 3, mitochondrial [Cryptomeria japonica]GLJ36597.1 hypothetical protein SUGI_0735720 [Cryptomeria japonica]
MNSFEFYLTSVCGGVLSCGITHAGLTPFDLVKCNMQANPSKFKSVSCVLGQLCEKHGVGALFRGWLPTLVGYSAQGAIKFGLYEFFKIFYADIVGPKNKTLICMAGSASAEFIADIALCPFEAVKLRVQTHPDMTQGFVQAFADLWATQGYNGFYKGLLPLWGRQIPYTMVKFACFEKTVDSIYKYMIPIPKEKCSKAVQLGVSFAAGYIAGVSSAVVSQPADNLFSILSCSSGVCVIDAIKNIGVVGLFTRGLPLRILMVGTMTGAQWGIYDAYKVYAKLPTSRAMARDLKM